MGQYRYTMYTSEMDPDGNILYVNNAPNIYVLSQQYQQYTNIF
jgi:hypothetical protein